MDFDSDYKVFDLINDWLNQPFTSQFKIEVFIKPAISHKQNRIK